MARLGDVFAVQIHGEWGNDCAENEVGTKVLRTTNFSSEGIINYNNIVTRSISPTKIEQKRLQYGDIILEKSGGTDKTPVGRVVFCDDAIEQDTYLCNNFTQAMRVNKDIAIPKYVFYFMLQMHASGKTDLLQNKTTGIRNMQVKLYLKEEIPLPPMEEQKKIAAVLDKVSDLIAKRRRQLDKLDLLVKARFVEMFGDPITNNNRLPMISLDKLGAWNSGGTPSRANPKYFSGEIDWYSAGELNSLYLTDSIEKITQEAINNSSAKLFREGSMLVGMYDTAAFKMGILQKASASNQACACIEPNDRVNIVWLYHVLQQMKDYFLQQRRGVRQKNLNLGMIKSFEIPFADKALQNQFADFVEQTEKTKTSISHSLEKLETLKKSQMQEYFE